MLASKPVRTAVLWTAAIVNVIALLGMVVTILMHSGRGGGLSDMFGGASGTALGAGHDPGSAGQRAILRMVIWAAFFGIFYGFLFFLGRSMGWWV